MAERERQVRRRWGRGSMAEREWPQSSTEERQAWEEFYGPAGPDLFKCMQTTAKLISSSSTPLPAPRSADDIEDGRMHVPSVPQPLVPSTSSLRCRHNEGTVAPQPDIQQWQQAAQPSVAQEAYMEPTCELFPGEYQCVRCGLMFLFRSKPQDFCCSNCRNGRDRHTEKCRGRLVARQFAGSGPGPLR